MSRGFVREEDQEEAPFIAPRAALPTGVTNHVTPLGLEELLRERKDLENQLKFLDIKEDKEKRHATAILNGKIGMLNERISSARVIRPEDQPADEVRFGATVSFKDLSSGKNNIQTFQLVGVDQANIKKQRIAFIAPLARALTGKRAGEVVNLEIGREKRELLIVGLSYKSEL